jgi:transposase
MTQQTQNLTAVEWLNQQLLDRQNGKGDSSSWDEILEQAKEIEKEQIEEAFSIGEMNNDSHHYTGRKIHQDQKDYFNKTYSK